MAKYLREFATQQEYEAYINGNPDLPNVSLIDEDDSVKYKQKPDYSKEYLTFTALEDGTFSFKNRNANDIRYSLDGGETWTQLPTDTNTPTVHTGEKIMWKGNIVSSQGFVDENTFSSTGNYNVEGNVMSLLYGDNFVGQTVMTFKLSYLFSKSHSTGTIISAENLILPATTLVSGCYTGMFNNCTSLTKAPELPATTLVKSCYSSMFYGCTSLTSSPELPATTLAESCYQQMFYGCTSLTSSPELPATTLAKSCYYGMFSNCTSLTTSPELPATTMVASGYSYMFSNCTSLETAPELPATSLINLRDAYRGMFYGCSSLNYIKMLATNTSGRDCLKDWVYGVSASGTFVKASSATLPTGTSGIPSGWEVINA